MTRLWWTQVKAVIRLELKKTFFAKRGLWIYVVAALPVLLFVAYAIATTEQQHRRASVAGQSERPLTYQDLMGVKPGMTSEEVIAILGKPPVNFHWKEDRRMEPEKETEPDTESEKKPEKELTTEVLHEDYHYSDGQNDL